MRKWLLLRKQTASQLGVVSPAELTQGQIVIGGDVAAVDKTVELLKEAGVKRFDSAECFRSAYGSWNQPVSN